MKGAWAEGRLRGVAVAISTVWKEGEYLYASVVPTDGSHRPPVRVSKTKSFRPMRRPLDQDEQAVERVGAVHLDVRALIARGWSQGTIRRHLGEPDAWLPVDHFHDRGGKRAWLAERVLAAETTEEVRKDLASLAALRTARQKGQA